MSLTDEAYGGQRRTREASATADDTRHRRRLDDGCTRLGRHLRTRRAQIIKAIFARVRGSGFDLTGFDDPEYVRGLQRTVLIGVDFGLTGIESHDVAAMPIPAIVQAQARLAARVGVNLDTVVRRYIAALALLEDVLIQEAERAELPDGVRESRLALGKAALLMDRIVATVIGAYTEELGRGDGGDGAGQPSAGRSGAGRSQSGTGRSSASEHAGVERSRGASSRTPGEVVALGTQRERILEALVDVVAEQGWAGTSIGLVASRAKVSRRTFCKLYPSIDDALTALMEQTLERLVALVSHAFEDRSNWRDGMLHALGAILAFFDSNPPLARVCVVETLGGGPVVLERRARMVTTFRATVVTRIESQVPQASPVAADGMLALVMGLVHTRLVARDGEPLVGLLGPLMEMIVRPFAASEQEVAEEVRRGEDLAAAIQAGLVSWPTADSVPENPPGRRLRECLLFLSRYPQSSNREIASGIGITHQSQISRLLSRLQHEGLITGQSEGAGKRKAWSLTDRGAQVAQGLSPGERTVA